MAEFVDLIGAARLVIAVILIAAAGLKVWSLDALRTFLGELGVPERLRTITGGLVVAAEGAVAVALLTAPPVVAGTATALLFTGFSIVLLRQGEESTGCGCMGALSRDDTSLIRKEIPRIGAAVAGLAIATGDPAATWFTPAAVSIASAGVLTYLAYVLVQQQQRMARPLAAGATTDEGRTTALLPLAPRVDGGVTPAPAATRGPGLPRRTFLGAIAGLPAALVTVPGMAWAREDRRHCGVGCGPNFACWCCAEVTHAAPTCACYPISEDPPSCPETCCDLLCCLLRDENCEDECILQRQACETVCNASCVDPRICERCHAQCGLEEQLCQQYCDNAEFLCALSACQSRAQEPAVRAEALV